ncbi:leucyl aminopeptidase family protein [Legionella pneumophila]|uniref:leucyl aminopeptidase family protein n=1 Tax=Legionella pneumophila TaxID=446 RepID=UPI0013750752|nr:leucyl aminopeptidase family protein [Legionella pneumophila]HAT8815650.1 leucyl aminopeptidase family protein [Legionella pneumophila subsp. pneumophila]MCZ4805045.1 leucyl aminopeptidase family protein [Legionella pneumophila]MDW9178136.1 leucyl aminopeptidase family protein [Legionella pneumophila]HAT1824089.1 leucyl aminopeptidase family protein [Legionella pneumophila]HAT1864504.1 leucyl aminopeptidase family protein [Legionella pneumophila]
MQAEVFYKSCGDRVVPVHLISQSQWDEGIENLTPMERNCFSVRQFKGKLGDYCFILNADGVIEKAFIGSGTGNQESALANAALLLPPGNYQFQDKLSRESGVVWALAQYRFDEYKKYELQPRVLIVEANDMDYILSLANSLFLVRDLINTPTCDMGPESLAHVVEELAKTHKAYFKQWIGEELIKDNFPAIHAVGRASALTPRLLSLHWGNEKHPRVTLIGKGVCFDSGGLDIKPSSGMRLMKKDMGGAAHVIGLAQWIMVQRLPIRLQVLIPAVENAIGPNAFRPGDVLTMRNGLTVEIENTDAEGRLILADALVKACEEKPDLIIDFATLTGAARVAVGTEIAAMFSNHDQLAQDIVAASNKVSDPVWRLPLFSPYEELLNSNIADMSNSSSSSYAGAITAGLFLQRFVTKSIPWVHFDIMAWNAVSKPGKPEGGEAMGLRAVAEYLLKTYG